MDRTRSLWLAIVVAIGAAVLLAGCSAVHVAGTASSSPSASPTSSNSATPSGSSSIQTGIHGAATAGPFCPVERVPPDAGCAPRPVIGAAVVIRDPHGKQVAQVHTGPDGTFLVAVPAGTYTVTAEETAGIMRAPGPQSVTVTDGVASVDLVYDTGIR
jgi:hypothetical protein